jgi:CHAT domain-containing protein
LAGFAHVVAAQWAVDDAEALALADDFYAGLCGGAADRPGGFLDPDRSAAALHDAVQRMRARGADPAHWDAYVHIGP